MSAVVVWLPTMVVVAVVMDVWAALLHGLLQGWDLVRCAELGNRIGAAKIASRGGQNYRFAA